MFFHSKKIHWHLNAGPDEFLQCASKATDAVSDSFHALMFSIIFGLNVRMLVPKATFRQDMFARIKEFEKYIKSGRMIVNNLPTALESIRCSAPVVFNMGKIEELRNISEMWLQSQLQTIA